VPFTPMDDAAAGAYASRRRQIMDPIGIIFLVLFALVALSLVPFGDSGRSVADRVSPRSAANDKNNHLG